MSEKPLTMRDICEFERNPEKDADIDYRNALRHLLRNAYTQREINKLADEELRYRDSTVSFYHYIFGKHPAENENSELFSESMYDDVNAEIKANDTASQFYDYISGYREAADVLVMNAMIRGNKSDRDESIFPICFLYRQYLELSLKDMYLYYSADTDDERSRYMKNTTHNLCHIWENKIVPMIKPLLEEQYQIEEFETVEGYIKEFQSLDADSYVFRYPIKKDRKQYHTSSRKVNILGLMNKMNKVEYFFAHNAAFLDVVKTRREESNNREEALSFLKKGNLEEALKSYNKALESRLSWCGEEHSDIAFLYAEISSVYIMQNKLEQAMELLTNALDISKRIHSTTFLFFIYQNMGMVLSMMKNSAEALKAFELSIEYGKTDEPLLIESYLFAARENRKIGAIEQAKIYYKKAVMLCKELQGENSEEYLNLVNESKAYLEKTE